jgi:Protein of unknown function (DUF4233)
MTSRPPGSPPPSGLRNPGAAVRGVGAGALGMEALAMLLAIQPLRTVGGGLGAAAVGVVVAFAVVLLLLTGLLRRGWAWYAAAGVQVLLLPAGLLHWALAVLGVVFGLVWGYVLHVRRRVLGPG